MPCYDTMLLDSHQAEVDDQDRREQELEAQQARSAVFFEQALSCEAKAWFTDPVRPYEARNATLSPDELLAETMWHESDPEYAEVRRLFAELITSEAAKTLRKEAARLLARQFPEAGDLNA